MFYGGYMQETFSVHDLWSFKNKDKCTNTYAVLYLGQDKYGTGEEALIQGWNRQKHRIKNQ